MRFYAVAPPSSPDEATRDHAPAPAWKRALISGGCAYEIVALWTPRLPTVTRVVHDRPWLLPVVIAAAVWHFIAPEQRGRR